MTSTTAFARLRDDLWLLATPKRAWISRAPPEFDTNSTCEASIRSLLDGAVAAALRLRSDQRPPSPPLTPTRWIWRLVGYYHLTHSTPGLLEHAARRFAAEGRLALARWAELRAREEDKHDLLALRDLEAMDVDPNRAIAALHPHPTEALVEWFRAAVHAPDPIGCLGYAYAVERLAMEAGPTEIAAVDAMLPAGAIATRCMRVHSSAGSDADHVRETVITVAQLPVAQREAVVRSTFEAACLCATAPSRGYPDDATIARRLADTFETLP